MSTSDDVVQGREQAVRIFKSDFLEFFTHISPVAVLVVWLPIIALFVYLGIGPAGDPWLGLRIPSGFLGGVFLWTLIEYILHRFLFHYHAKSERGKRISYMFHGVHHAQPMVKTRLVMPPVVSLAIGALAFGLYWLVGTLVAGSFPWTAMVFAGTAFGYLMYDMIHYATHHFNIKNPLFKWIRSHHMKHHVMTPDARFGVSTPLWDWVFRTEPSKAGEKALKS